MTTYYDPYLASGNITLSTGASTTSNSYTIGIASQTSGSGIISGSPYIVGGSNGSSWQDLAVASQSTSGKVKIMGENADLEINGKSMKEWMERVESRLAILSPNTELEKEWSELKELGDQYRELERHIKEKMKTWDILNKE